MTTNDPKPFTARGGWKNFQWTQEPASETGLRDLFTVEGTLLIGFSQGGSTYKLVWLDPNRQFWEISALQPTTENSQILGGRFPGGKYRLSLTLDPDPNSPQLTGVIYGSPNSYKPGGGDDELVGTFTAKANPNGANLYGRSPHWLGWLQRLFHRPDEPGRDEPFAV